MLKEFLTTENTQTFIRDAFKRKMDALQVSTALAKQNYTNEDRAAIMDYMALVPKFREKFGLKANEKGAEFLLCDKLALEQSTAQDIGRWKGTLWPSGSDAEGKTVHDLCCGMGGDSFFLPKAFKVVGVDLDENRLAMYNYNNRIMRSADAGGTILADVREIAKQNETAQASHADYFTIDPARRAIEGENQRDLRNLTPTFEEVLEIARHYKGGMAKLPPGYPTTEIPKETEIIYIGGHADCRECLVLFGELAKHPATVRAVIVDKAGNATAEWNAPRDARREIRNESEQQHYENNLQLEGRDRIYRTASSQSDLPLGEISKYLSEPAAVLVRSRLFGYVALESGASAHLISEGIAYVSSEKPLPSLGFTNFEVLDHTEISTSAVRAMLKKHDVGKLTLKLRGVKLDPEAEIKRLKPKGKNSATLFYTRAAGEKIAILGLAINN